MRRYSARPPRPSQTEEALVDLVPSTHQVYERQSYSRKFKNQQPIIEAHTSPATQVPRTRGTVVWGES
jgi:hypothetical protein